MNLGKNKQLQTGTTIHQAELVQVSLLEMHLHISEHFNPCCRHEHLLLHSEAEHLQVTTFITLAGAIASSVGIG